MQLWLFNTGFYGRPNDGLNQTQGNQFMAGVSDVGAGRYHGVNPTASYPVDLSWTFTDAQYQQFVLDWNDRTRFCWGNGWFWIDLPLMLDWPVTSPTAPVPTIGLTSITNRIGVETTTGEITNRRIHGLTIKTASLAGTTFTLEFFEGTALPYVVNNTITANFLGTEVDLTFNGTAYVGTVNGVVWDPGWNYFDITFQAAREQTYKAHALEPYTSQLNGYNHWDVSLPVEVDLTPEPMVA